jgi:hypothetical protein
LVIEPVLHLAHGAHGVLDFRVACEHEERRIGEVTLWWRCGGIGAYLGSLITFGMYRGHYIVKACVGRYEGGDGVDGIVGVWCKEGEGEESELCVSELLAIALLHEYDKHARLRKR